MERDIAKDRALCEEASSWDYNTSDWEETQEQGRRVKELIEKALPYYISRCEQLETALIHISEYWNGQHNHNAMADALHEIEATAAVALGGKTDA